MANRSKSSTFTESLTVIVLIGTVGSITYVPFFVFPIMSFIFPQVHFFFEDKSPNFIWKLIISILNAMKTTIVPIAGGLMVTLSMINVLIIQLTVDNFRKLVKRNYIRRYSNKVSEFRDCMIAKSYRELQMVQILSNGYAQAYLMPTIEFHGSCMIIIFIFCLLSFWRELDALVIFGLVLVTIFTGGFQNIVFEFASRPFLCSGKTLSFCRKRYAENSVFLQKFFASCQPIALRMGVFHRIDRERWPSLIRFISQRTFFLLKATQSNGT